MQSVVQNQLAQINIARMVGPIDSPQLAEFVANLDRINALAESSPGFVWRLKTDDGNATDINAFGDDLIIVNMSVWENIEALRDFAFKTAHSDIMKRRREWFEKFPTAYLALWWIPVGHVPTVDEAKVRLKSLDEQGDTPFAFTFKKLFPTPDTHAYQSEQLVR